MSYALDQSGLSRRELGQRMSGLGFTTWGHSQTMQRFFDGERNVPLDELIALALCLAIPLETLIAAEPVSVDQSEVVTRLRMIQVGELKLTARDVESVICVGRGSSHWDRNLPQVYVDWWAWDGETKPPPIVRPKSAAEAQRELVEVVERLASELGIAVLPNLDPMEAVRLLWAELRKRETDNGEA